MNSPLLQEFLLIILAIHCHSSTFTFPWRQQLLSSVTDDDRIRFIPGLNEQPTFAQYSGYLQGSSSNYQLHYWLIEAERDPGDAPLVLWLNGGPGCSSMEGLLSENGPFTVRPNAKLEPNPHSWNKFANMLYLEAPAGVGYSFAVDHNTTTGDDLTSLNNYHALLHFIEKFPAYRDRDFYITGESYAGFYVPLLALRVLENKPNGLNLKGIAVGNGLTNVDLNDNSLLYFLNYHGIVDESVWKDSLDNCCGSQCATKCMFLDDKSYKCRSSVTAIMDLADGLNTYNLYHPCYGGVDSLVDRIKKGLGLPSHKKSFRPEFGEILRRNLARSVRSDSRDPHDPRDRLYLPCTDDTVITEYMNNPEVRKALNIHPQAAEEWAVCDDQVYFHYVREYKDMSAAYLKVLDFKVPVLLYAGDVDMACNFLGILWFVDQLGLPMSKPMNHFIYDESDQTKQIGGFYKVLHRNNVNLTYVTVRGAGHMVPEDKPIVAYHIITRFINKKEL